LPGSFLGIGFSTVCHFLPVSDESLYPCLLLRDSPGEFLFLGLKLGSQSGDLRFQQTALAVEFPLLRLDLLLLDQGFGLFSGFPG
jgi:hypothetical protein